MKIGDRVRFLSDVGGGVIAGFQKGNIVLVEDADGFQMPVPQSEVVVVETDDYNIAKVVKPEQKKKEEKKEEEKKEAEDPLDRPVTFRPKPQERRDGDRLNVFLDFLPVSIKELSATKFECYLVNDCNYFIAYTLLSAENATWKLRSQGVIEPNTKVYVEDIDHSMLNDIGRLAVQLIAWKQDTPFFLKPAVTTDLRIDITKFYKLHTFRESLFFEEPVLEFGIVEADEPHRPLVISARQLKQAMYEKGDRPQAVRRPVHKEEKPDPHAIVEVDLHAHELLDTTAGMSAADIKEYQLKVFRDTMNKYLHDKGRRIVFIHGKGEGVLRQAILSEIKHTYKSCTCQDASFQQYGFGATMVIIH